jgi:hypothetical protein
MGDESGCLEYRGHPLVQNPISGDGHVADEEEPIRIRPGDDEFGIVLGKLSPSHILFVECELHTEQRPCKVKENGDRRGRQRGRAIGLGNETHEYPAASLGASGLALSMSHEISLHTEVTWGVGISRTFFDFLSTGLNLLPPL